MGCSANAPLARSISPLPLSPALPLSSSHCVALAFSLSLHKLESVCFNWHPMSKISFIKSVNLFRRYGTKHEVSLAAPNLEARVRARMHSFSAIKLELMSLVSAFGTYECTIDEVALGSISIKKGNNPSKVRACKRLLKGTLWLCLHIYNAPGRRRSPGHKIVLVLN